MAISALQVIIRLIRLRNPATADDVSNIVISNKIFYIVSAQPTAFRSHPFQ